MAKDLNAPLDWRNSPQHIRRFGGFANWIKYYHQDEQAKDSLDKLKSVRNPEKYIYSDYRKIVDNELMPLFRHKDTMFYLLIPPYSALFWAWELDNFDEMMAPVAYLIEQTKDLPNVKIYWLYDEDFVFDIARYKDLTHYDAGINTLMTEAIRNGSNIINAGNYQSKIARFKHKINHFDISDFTAQAQKIF